MTLYEHLDSHSERTRVAIESDLARYCSWCQRMEVTPIPASEDQVAAWLEDAIDEGLKVSTIRRLLYSVGQAHEARGFIPPSKQRSWKPRWDQLMAKLELNGQTERSQADELNAVNVAKVLATLGDSLHELRDGALLALALDTLFKPSELVELCREHIIESADGSGQVCFIPENGSAFAYSDTRWISPDTLRRVLRWCEAAGILHGPLARPIGGRRKGPKDASSLALRSQEISRIFRRRAQAAGLIGYFTAYSPRVGGAMDLARAGATVEQIRTTGGWRSAFVIDRSTSDLRGATPAMRSLKLFRES